MVFIPYSEYQPDVAHIDGACDIATNVIPETDGYSPLPSLIEDYPPIPNGIESNSFYAHYYTDTDYDIFLGHSTGILRLNRVTNKWESVLEGVHCGYRWSFCSYRDICLTTNIDDFPRQFLRKNEKFTPLTNTDTTIYYDIYQQIIPNNPVPRAETIWHSNGTIFLINGNRISWSAPDNITFWTFGQNGAGFVNVPQSNILYVSSDLSPILLCDRGIYLLNRTGQGFNLVSIDPQRGVLSPWAAATVDGTTYFVDRGGFYELAGGSVSLIGYQCVDNSFKSWREDKNTKWSVTADPFSNRIIFGSEKGSLIYAYRLNRWSYSTHCGVFCGLVPLPNTLEAQIIPKNQLPQNSISYRRGNYCLAYLSADSLYNENGCNEEAEINTGWSSSGDGSTCLDINAIYNRCDGDAPCFTAIQYSLNRNYLRNECQKSKTESCNDGRFSFRVRARFWRVIVHFAKGSCWSRYQGSDVDGVASGYQ